MQALASSFAWILVFFARKNNLLIYRNIKIVYGLPKHSEFARRFLQQVYSSQFLILLEMLVELTKPGSIGIEGGVDLERVLKDLNQKKRAGIIISAHLGNWELVARSMARYAPQGVDVLAKPSRSKLLNSRIEKIRKKFGSQVLWIDRVSLGRQMLKSLQQNKVIGIVMDQKPQGRVGPKVLFLGQATEFVGGPARLALKYAVPIYGVYCVRVGFLTYRLFLEKIYDGEIALQTETSENSSTNNIEQQELELTQRCADSVSRAIQLYPEQWVWNYKRWR